MMKTKNPQPDFSKRRERALRAIRSVGARNLLITSPHNVRYLTGFTGEDSFLYLASHEAILMSDGRYQEQIESEVRGVDVLIRQPSESIVDAAAKALSRRADREFWVEGSTTSIAQWERLETLMPSKSLAVCSGVIERLREIKDAYELSLIQESIGIAQRAFQATSLMLEPQMTEKQIADDLEFAMRKMGAESAAFKIIVGVGPRSALPHGQPSNKLLGESSFVLIDWGAKKNAYMSDITRVCIFGKPSARLEKMYRAVLDAQLAAIREIRPGAIMGQIDAAARKSLERAGLEKRFTHGLGHSFGLEIHESVRLGKGQLRPLEKGMVLTVEPGVYIPGFGGVRIEDDILVTEDGCEILTDLPKTWEEVSIAKFR